MLLLATSRGHFSYSWLALPERKVRAAPVTFSQQPPYCMYFLTSLTCSHISDPIGTIFFHQQRIGRLVGRWSHGAKPVVSDSCRLAFINWPTFPIQKYAFDSSRLLIWYNGNDVLVVWFEMLCRMWHFLIFRSLIMASRKTSGKGTLKYPVFIFPSSFNFYMDDPASLKQVVTLYNPYDIGITFKGKILW